MKLLHFSDLHAREKDYDEIAKCAGFICDQAEEEKPDLVVFSGDAAHSRDIKMESRAARLIVETFSRLADIAPVVAVRGTPLHDGNVPEILSMVRGAYPIHVATQPEQVYLIAESIEENTDGYTPDAVISLLPQPTKEHWAKVTGSSISTSDQEIGGLMGGLFAGFGGMAAEFPGVPHILVGHFTVTGSQTSTGQTMIGREIEVSRQQIDLARADLTLLGHIHKQQALSSRIWYAGSIYRENFGEQEDKGFMLYEMDGHSLMSAAFVQTPTKKLSQVKMDTTTEGYDLQEGLADTDFSGASVRVEIRTWQDEAAQIDRASIEQELVAKGAAEVEIRIIRVPRETVRSSAVIHLHSLRDKILELARTRGEEVAPDILEKADLLEQGLPLDLHSWKAVDEKHSQCIDCGIIEGE